MKQLTQTFRTGTIEINDVPIPTLHDSFVLVRNRVSVISAGTEKTKVDMGRKNLIQKAKARPDLVKQVIKKLKTQGIKNTLQAVNSRLDSLSPLGYSCAGEVVAVGGLVEGIQVSDRVACAGADYANHAEYVAVPKNLVLKVPDNLTYEAASFATIGAIGLQGVRLADPKIGEVFAVIGLGLIGQIVTQLLRANGCTVICFDLDSDLVARAEKESGVVGVVSSDDLKRASNFHTNEQGVDGVLICAGTNSNEPIELSGEISRKKARIVVVGAVKMDIPRDSFFKKEINVVISRSYGPGRYDPCYEENGNDYPYDYVRFTEKRNMETFLNLINDGSVDVLGLVTHRFGFDSAAEAYELIEGKIKREPYLGILLNYTTDDEVVTNERVLVSGKPFSPVNSNQMSLSFFGAGNYASSTLLPILDDCSDVLFNGIVSASGRTAKGVAEKFNFNFSAPALQDILEDSSDAICITTRHDSHAASVVSSINAGKHVYVEKPLSLSVKELSEIDEAYSKSETSQLMVGFNRRFAPLTRQVRDFFLAVEQPLIINMRVNAGKIPSDHWIQDPKFGGGRIIGEACHFVDLASALCNSIPTKVHSMAATSNSKPIILNDNLVFQIAFTNGSVATITYTSEGGLGHEKEYIEIFGGGQSALIYDFKYAEFFSEGFHKRTKKKSQDKGQASMISAWIEGIKKGVPCVDYETLMLNSLTTILAVESLTVGAALDVNLEILR